MASWGRGRGRCRPCSSRSVSKYAYDYLSGEYVMPSPARYKVYEKMTPEQMKKLAGTRHFRGKEYGCLLGGIPGVDAQSSFVLEVFTEKSLHMPFDEAANHHVYNDFIFLYFLEEKKRAAAMEALHGAKILGTTLFLREAPERDVEELEYPSWVDDDDDGEETIKDRSEFKDLPEYQKYLQDYMARHNIEAVEDEGSFENEISQLRQILADLQSDDDIDPAAAAAGEGSNANDRKEPEETDRVQHLMMDGLGNAQERRRPARGGCRGRGRVQGERVSLAGSRTGSAQTVLVETESHDEPEGFEEPFRASHADYPPLFPRLIKQPQSPQGPGEHPLAGSSASLAVTASEKRKSREEHEETDGIQIERIHRTRPDVLDC